MEIYERAALSKGGLHGTRDNIVLYKEYQYSAHMNFIRKTMAPVLLATIWISISEFTRNEFLLKDAWTEHYRNLGLIFPSEPINGAIWGLWSLCFATAIFFISRKFNLIQTTLLAWLMGFVMMWLVIGNLAVLPEGLLLVAVPLSFIEAFVAAFIITRISQTKERPLKEQESGLI
jgi:hypothetical protein